MQWIITKARTWSTAFTPVGMGSVSRQAKHILKDLPQEAKQSFVDSYAECFSHEFQILNTHGTVDCAGACQEPSQHSLLEVFAPLDYAMSMWGSTTLQTRYKGSSSWVTMKPAKA